MKYPFLLIPAIILSSHVFAQLKATEDSALIKVTFTDFEDHPKAGETILFKGKNSGIVFKGVTNSEGKLEILLPEGDVYEIKYLYGTIEEDYSDLEIPAKPGRLGTEILMKFAPAKKWVLNNVLFDTGKATLRPESYEELDKLVEVMKNKPRMVIEIAGHTDNVGDDDYNLKLSQQRAETVRQYLIDHGIDPARVKAKGYGETQPVAPNDTEEGRQLNRRTEVRVLSDE